MPENPASGLLDREPVHGMVLWRDDDPRVQPWGWRLYVENVEPQTWITVEALADLIRHSDGALALGLEPKAEIRFRDGVLLTLTLRAENGTWVWRFGEYDFQRDAYRIEWPD